MRPAAALFTAILYLAAAHVAEAVVVATGDGTQNTTAPSDDFGFANVGLVYNTADGFYASGVYLGNGWVLTAYHVVRDASLSGFRFSDVVFHDPILGDTTFAVNPSTAIRLQNSDSTFTDLALFQLTTVADLSFGRSPSPPLCPRADPPVMMAGGGVNRQSALTCLECQRLERLDRDHAAAGIDATGYKEIQGSQTLRWGTNTIESQNTLLDAGYGNLTVFTTDFDNVSNQAQAAAGDSGGGVFYKNGSTWELAGIINATGTPTTISRTLPRSFGDRDGRGEPANL